jgi:hypothetical protein
MKKESSRICAAGLVSTTLLQLALFTAPAFGQPGVFLPGLGESAVNIDVTESGPPNHTPTALVSITCCDPLGNPVIQNQGTASEGVENLINDEVVFDGIPPNTTRWGELQGDLFMIPIEIRLDQPRTVRYYTLTSTSDAPERDPWEWRFLGTSVANPMPSDFVLLDQRTGVDFPERHQTQLFGPFNNDTAFTTYRFEFETQYVAVGAANYPPNEPIPNSIQLAELELFEQFTIVPEPSSAILLSCFAVLGLVRRRRG